MQTSNARQQFGTVNQNRDALSQLDNTFSLYMAHVAKWRSFRYPDAINEVQLLHELGQTTVTRFRKDEAYEVEPIWANVDEDMPLGTELYATYFDQPDSESKRLYHNRVREIQGRLEAMRVAFEYLKEQGQQTISNPQVQLTKSESDEVNKYLEDGLFGSEITPPLADKLVASSHAFMITPVFNLSRYFLECLHTLTDFLGLIASGTVPRDQQILANLPPTIKTNVAELYAKEQTLIICYEGEKVINKGEPNYKHYIVLATPAKRVAYANKSNAQAKPLIKSIKKILPYLSARARQQAESEINTMEANIV